MALTFNCQRCKQPLQLDESLQDLQPSTYDLIASTVNHSAQTQPNAYAQPHRQFPSRLPATLQSAYTPIPSHRFPTSPSVTTATNVSSLHPSTSSSSIHQSSNPAESFVLLSDSQVVPPPNHSPPTPKSTTLSNRLKTSARLFSLLSRNSNIDHPLCSECTQLLLDAMNAQVEEVKKEVERYKGFENDIIRRRKEKGKVDIEELEKEIGVLDEKERVVRAEVEKLDKEVEDLKAEMKILEEEEEELEKEEEAFWRANNAYLTDLDRYTTQSRSLLTRYKHDSQALEKLQRTNVYNDAFCIGHEGGLATINGLRLGRLPNLPVEWPEINAAWGQTLLLLVTIARKLDCHFTSYRPIPQGSFSRIEKLSDNSILELYGSGDFGVGRLFLNRRFDHAMVAFLELLRQLMEHAMERGGKTRNLKLHHQVVKDKIGEVSIKLQFGNDETWTRALRHVLLNMKILLAFASDYM